MKRATLLCRHPGDSRGPELRLFHFWIPASAGMTTFGIFMILITLLSFAAVGNLFAEPPRSPQKDDVVLRAMKDEMDRTMMKLRLGDFLKPYFVAYTVQEGTEASVEGNFGGLMDASSWSFRHAKVTLRVGDYDLDNSNFVSRARDCRPVTGDLPIEDDYNAIRFALWALTDQAYKQALECYSAKKAYLATKAIRHDHDDFSREKPSVYFDPAPLDPVDTALWSERVKELSAVFRKYPSVNTSSVYLSAMPRKVRYVNSEGSKFIKNASLWEFGTSAKAQASDGYELTDSRVFYGHSVKELPDMRQMGQEVEKFAQEMTAWVHASTMDAYVGPVFFEDQAAGEFFHHLLSDQISFARAPLQEDEDRKVFDPGALVGRLNARVAAPMLSAVDDPRIDHYNGTKLFGHYHIDDEGVLASPIQVLERGKLTDIPMGRSPTLKKSHSNGHGRGGLYATPAARSGVLVVRADRTEPKNELKKRLRSLTRDQGFQDFGLIIRRTDPDEKKDISMLPTPVSVFKIDYRTGKEEQVRGVQFSGVTLRALKDVLAASDTMYVHNFYNRGPYRENMDYAPTSIVAPSILVQEVEVKPTEAKPSKLPYLQHPFFEKDPSSK